MALGKRSYNIPALYGGCRYVDHILSLDRSEAYILKNVHINDRGIVYTRGGSTLLNSTAPKGSVTNIHEYTRTSGSQIVREILAVIGANWYSFDGSTLTRIYGLSTNAKPSVVTFNDGSGNSIAILVNGVDFLKYDGSDVTALISMSDFVASRVPRYLFVYDNYLHASGCIDTPTRIYTSNLLDPTAWDSDAYFQYDSDGNKEPITGIGSAWSYLVAFKKNQIYMDSEGDPTSSTLEQIKIAEGHGTTSHWGIVTVGDNIYFPSQNGYFSGVLRRETTDGLKVTNIGDNVQKKFDEVTDYNEIEGIHDAKHQSIRFGTKTGGSSTYNTEFSYNLALSGEKADGSRRDVWDGWWEGTNYEPASYGLKTNSNGSFSIYRGDSHGRIYLMEDDFVFKDDDYSATEQNIETLIHLAPLLPYGLVYRKNFRKIVLYLFQQVNGSTTFEINNSGRTRSLSSNMEIKGHIPYWNNDNDVDKVQTWDGTLWADAPMLPYEMTINQCGSFIEIILTNNGDNDQDSIAYGGGQLIYQVKRGI